MPARRQQQGVGQHHAAFGIGVHDLDGGAVQRRNDVVLLVGAGRQMVVGNGQPAVDGDRQLQFGRRQHQRQGHRGTVHVLVHAGHVTGGLEIVATGVETNALADQRHRLLRRRVFQAGVP